MSEDKGSAEEQAERIDERAGEVRSQRREGEGYGMTRREREPGSIRRFGRRVLANPAGPLVAGLALIVGSAAVIAVQQRRAHPRLWSLKRRSRIAAEALREGDYAVRPRVFAVMARLAALGLAGVTWRRMRALAR